MLQFIVSPFVVDQNFVISQELQETWKILCFSSWFSSNLSLKINIILPLLGKYSDNHLEKGKKNLDLNRNTRYSFYYRILPSCFSFFKVCLRYPLFICLQIYLIFLNVIYYPIISSFIHFTQIVSDLHVVENMKKMVVF